MVSKILSDTRILTRLRCHSSLTPSENIYIDNSYYSPYSLGWYPYYGRSYRRVSHTTSEGVLYIDIIDTNSKQLVWQGKGIGFLSSHKMNRDESKST